MRRYRLPFFLLLIGTALALSACSSDLTRGKTALETLNGVVNALRETGSYEYVTTIQHSVNQDAPTTILSLSGSQLFDSEEIAVSGYSIGNNKAKEIRVYLVSNTLYVYDDAQRTWTRYDNQQGVTALGIPSPAQAIKSLTEVSEAEYIESPYREIAIIVGKIDSTKIGALGAFVPGLGQQGGKIQFQAVVDRRTLRVSTLAFHLMAEVKSGEATVGSLGLILKFRLENFGQAEVSVPDSVKQQARAAGS